MWAVLFHFPNIWFLGELQDNVELFGDILCKYNKNGAFIARI